ncbi:MAG: tRNA (adenosine(37)-N6)-threonylcarbamoyltransferase complex dimerization subunit type 1 TsaB [Bacteroidota bacterium]|nr:tRNA (adenosine(37)-N6)-threonylcarbamoyltransferase complex dimerization subunit type 1 TsaB [Bacteroidota bacterium]
MALILNIETATGVCSVAVALDGKMVASRQENSGQSHAKLLTTFIKECIHDAGFALKDLDAVAVSKGPGSFTGLRIGVASAKGLCYALDKPLISVNTLQSMATYFLANTTVATGSWLCPMIDARRMEVYTAFFNNLGEFEVPTAAEIIEAGSFTTILEDHLVNFFGDGTEKVKHLFENQPNAVFHPDFLPSASGMILFSEKSYKMKEFEVAAYFEPFYLKDFFNPRQPNSGVNRQE